MALSEKDIIDMIPLDSNTTELASNIIKESDLDEIKRLTQLFNLNQAKKNVLRVLKLNSLLDKVSDQMLERFEKRPGEFSNSDLINYMTVTQNAIDRANKSLNLVNETPAIQVNVNVDNDPIKSIDKESKERIMAAVNAILQKSKELDLDADDIQEEIVVDNTVLKEEDNIDE